MNKKINGEKLYNAFFFALPMAFYLSFWLYDGAVWCADIASYVEMHRCREPLYPIYLAFCRLLCGGNQDTSLFIAVFGQSLLAAVATWSLARYLTKSFDVSKAVSFLILFMPMATSLLCRFAAKRSSMYSNSILTESIAISIYLLFFRFCSEYLFEKSRRSLIICLILCFVGISLRKQMYVIFCLLVIAVIYVLISSRSKWQKYAKYAVSILVLLCAIRLFDCTYNLMVHNHFMRHDEDNRFVTTMAFYTAEREYVEYVDPRLQDIYLSIYDICEENGWLMHDAPDNWADAVEFFSNSYDHIQLDTMEIVINDYLNTGADYSWLGEGAKADLIRESFNASLLPHEIPALIYIVFWNFVSGLVVTIAVFRKIFCIYALVAYPLLVGLTIWCLIKWIKNKECTLCKRGYELGMLTILGILGNVLLVAAVIFTQTRYMIYNMPIFYMTMIVLLNTCWKTYRKK